MYQTFIFYIIVILVYTARPERPQELLQTSYCLPLILALFLLFFGLVRKRCQRLSQKRYLSDDQLPALYDRLQTQLQIGAIIFFFGMVYGADLGALIELLPLVKRSEGLNNLLGLSIFFLLQIIIWRESHRYFAERILLIRPCRAYVKARLRFALGLVIPWLSILFVIDFFSLWLPQALQQALAHPLGEIALFVLFLITLTIAAPPLLVHLWQCKKLPDSPLRQAIVELCRQQRVGYREIMLWPPFESRMATAAVVGAFPFSRYLLITPDLMRLLRDVGLFGKETIDIGGSAVRPLDVAAKLLFPAWEMKDGEEDISVMRVIIEGRKNGTPVKRVYELLDNYDRESQTTSMARTTGYTCAAAVRLIANGRYTRQGISPPEYLGADKAVYDELMAQLAERNIQFTESISS